MSVKSAISFLNKLVNMLLLPLNETARCQDNVYQVTSPMSSFSFILSKIKLYQIKNAYQQVSSVIGREGMLKTK